MNYFSILLESIINNKKYDNIEFNYQDINGNLTEFGKKKYLKELKTITVSKAYFITEKDLGQSIILKPKNIVNYLTKNGFEDANLRRICVSTSISKCLCALSKNVEGKVYHVYITKNKTGYKPSKKLVPDCDITGEIWFLNDTSFEKESIIKVIGNEGKDGKSYKYGNNKIAYLYDDWIYEKINK